MKEIISTTIIGTIFGTIGTVIGGIIGTLFKNASNKFLSFTLSFASGLMMAVVCFDLIPEALEITSIINVLMGIIFGIIVMIFCDIIVSQKFKTSKALHNSNNSILKTGIIVSIGLAIHNFPEGLAIGSGFEASLKLGLSLAIAICLHDIPERNVNGNTNEKRWNKNMENNILCNIIGDYDRDRSLFWRYNRINLKDNNINMFKFCSRSNAIYSLGRIDARIK